ncbi:MAG: sel1 repeat family protein [Firmicutes bacterium]|nr:sel1 repeat family protein [Bacillota bacterium]
MDNLYAKIEKAENGDKTAQMEVANYIIFEQGDDIDSDWAERAIKYYELAAAQGVEWAFLNLSVVYRFGKGVPKNREKTFYWLEKAAEHLYPTAFRYLGYALQIPVGYLDENDETADYKSAFGYFFKGAMLGDADCFYKVGDMYFSGKFVEEDKIFAFEMYKNSKNLMSFFEFSSSLALRLGECYFYAIGTKQNLKKAKKYFEQVIENVEEKLADGENPYFVVRTINRSKFLLKQLKNGKIPPAYNKNTENKITKKVIKNSENKFKFLAKRVLQEINRSSILLEKLAYMYKTGIFVEKDLKFSAYLFEISNANQ